MGAEHKRELIEGMVNLIDDLVEKHQDLNHWAAARQVMEALMEAVYIVDARPLIAPKEEQEKAIKEALEFE